MLLLLVLKMLEGLVVMEVLGELVMLVGMLFYFCSMEETLDWTPGTGL